MSELNGFGPKTAGPLRRSCSLPQRSRPDTSPKGRSDIRVFESAFFLSSETAAGSAFDYRVFWYILTVSMEKTSPSPLERIRCILPLALNILFYGSICWVIAVSELPPIQKFVFFMRKQFLAANESFFRIQDPGLPYAAFEFYLPRKGNASFLTDTPYAHERSVAEKLQAAQGRLAPLLINPAPSERIALVFCSNDAIAAARMQATGYRPLKALGNGKWIAEHHS